ncbi:taste receptor type 1 member 1 [Passer montanus]|uniref:taste receptor type 1 member 1 n=1 Tax=Passer montanus TaxID=9160 RepID=UPI001961D3F7|nr:taste receptor type 1 member 1 [Passer montanus]
MLPPALLRLCLCAAAAAAASPFSLRGDHRLAGLFPLHTEAHRDEASLLVRGCDDAAFKSHGYCLSQALRFAVEEINNSTTLLPNVTLGYEIYDTCSEPTNFHATLCALARKGRQGVQVLPSFQHYEPQAVAVIGPDSTRLALTTAAVLSLFLVPEISYEASTELLSLKRLYPSFLRTIPSDRQQVKAIFLLLQHFGWTWVALLGSDNIYGRTGLDALQELLTASNVCVGYRATIPANSDANNPELHNLVQILTEVKVNVTVVFSNRGSVLPFFEVVVQRNVTGMVWVASEDWSLAQTIWQVPGIHTIGSVFGMAVEKPEPTMLERFEAWRMWEEGAVAESASSAEAGSESVGNARLDCTQRCTGCRVRATVPDMYDAQGSFNVYSAVYAVAHGLHDLLGCASGACSKGTVYPWQLLQKIREVNFTLYESRISFDAHGDIQKGYDIVMWKWLGSNWASDVIGTFRVNPERLSIDPGKILWHTEDGQAPSSVCSEACKPGEMRLQQSRHKCCFSCVACPPGTFLNTSGQYTTGFAPALSSPAHILPPAPVSPFPASHLLWSVKPLTQAMDFGRVHGANFRWEVFWEKSPLCHARAGNARRNEQVRWESRAQGAAGRAPHRGRALTGSEVCEVSVSSADPFDCQACGLDEWSPAGSEVCFNRTVEFLSWSEPLSWVLLALAALLMLLIAALVVLFALNASTPVVKSAGGKTCFLMLGSLACTCSSLFCYFGEPSQAACLLRVPLFAISFTVFLSCVATRSFQILCIFKLNARWPALYEAWMRRQGPVLFVAASTAAQVALCVATEAVSPSVPRREYRVWADRVVLECAQSDAADAAIAYTLLLSAGCFALSYAGTDLPAAYNEAKSLTVSLLLHLGCSAAVLCSQGALRGRADTAARVLGTLGTLAAVLGGYFVPRAFVILLRPHQNTAEHFQMAIQEYTRRLAAA